MIISFGSKETEALFEKRFSKRIPRDIAEVALRKLLMIQRANCLSDLRIPPSNRLEKLLGGLNDRWSIRINDQWRVVFTPLDDGKNYANVAIVDYH